MKKKQAEYSYVKDSHLEFYKKGGKIFVRKHADAILRRTVSMGFTIAESWQQISDTSEVWAPVTKIEPRRADDLRIVPHNLQDRGISVTLEAIKKEAKIEHTALDFAINQAIQHEYLKTYLEEYDAAIIEDIPPKARRLNYLIKTDNIYYNYYVFNSVLEIFNLNKYLKNAPARTINNIRQCIEYLDFLDLYESACRYYNDIVLVKKYFLELKKVILRDFSRIPSFNFIIKWDTSLKDLKNLLSLIMDKSYSVPFTEVSEHNWNNPTHFLKETKIMNNKIFIVHGRNIPIRNDIELFVRRLGLEPIILAEQANKGMTIIEKIEDYSDVSYAIILYTPCDEGRKKGEQDLNGRARQNVIFEHGYMAAKLGRNKVLALVEQDVEIPGDLDGIVYISLKDSDWKIKVMRELDTAGLKINWKLA